MKNLLKMMRWETGMKQYELAIKLHCSAPYLSLVENGRIDPPEAFKARAAQIFKIGVEEIFPETEKAFEKYKNATDRSVTFQTRSERAER
jgi:DNA-binding XRE family transcriptional regulator